MDESTSLSLMRFAGALNPKLSGMAGDYLKESDMVRERADLEALSPIYTTMHTNPTEAGNMLMNIRPRSAKGTIAFRELAKSIKEESETRFTETAQQRASDPEMWKPVLWKETVKTPAFTDTEGREREEGGYAPPTEVERSRPAKPMDVIGRMPFLYRTRAIDTIEKIWRMQHGNEGNQLATDLEAKRLEIRNRGLDPYDGLGADEYRRYYAERNPGSTYAQTIIAGDSTGEVPQINKTLAERYGQSIATQWEALESDEKQLLDSHYAMVQDAIETLRMDPRTKPQQTLARTIEFARQVTAVQRFNQTMGFKNKEFADSRSRFDEAMRLRRESADLQRKEFDQRSEKAKLDIQAKRFNVDRQAERLAIQAFDSLNRYIYNLRSMSDADPMVQRMREIARQMSQLYLAQFPGLVPNSQGGASIVPPPAPTGVPSTVPALPQSSPQTEEPEIQLR